MSRASNSGPGPKLACEIWLTACLPAGSRKMAGARWSRVPQMNSRRGAWCPDLIETNLRQPDGVYEALRDTLASLGGRSRDVIAVLPDAAVRVVLLDSEISPKREEAEAVVRFRLKKSLPFDVDKAKVSYHVQPSNSGVRVIAAVALLNVIEDYEAAFRQAGYEPGVVMPSMLAALGAASTPAIAGDQGRCTNHQHCHPGRPATFAVPHIGEYARRDHNRGATGGRGLSNTAMVPVMLCYSFSVLLSKSNPAVLTRDQDVWLEKSYWGAE